MRRFLQDDSGATSIEYAIMVGMIAALIVGVVTQIGDRTAYLIGLVLPGFM